MALRSCAGAARGEDCKAEFAGKMPCKALRQPVEGIRGRPRRFSGL